MKFNFTARDFKFFILGVFTMLLFVIIYDWDQFEKGLKGYSPNDTAKIENIK
ncbi:hypothetical protein [Christiangramia echinicola]|uniref:Uncharacterized protein n=1 Tax=Christiangramia echinicola TaxID=279359 RepID=A0A1H1KWV4_9FLAO|nr:hypothetical protein [Christiangramia echinicola]SDR66265.1 hypothetical protein SAMN04488552_0264 [Christiangramia echinicola]